MSKHDISHCYYQYKNALDHYYQSKNKTRSKLNTELNTSIKQKRDISLEAVNKINTER